MLARPSHQGECIPEQTVVWLCGFGMAFINFCVADALFTQGLMALMHALMQPIICCVGAQSAREFVTEFSGGATRRTEAVWGSEL